MLISVLPELNRNSTHLDMYGITLRKLLQNPELREHVRTHEGVARILNALLPAHLVTTEDRAAIAAASGVVSSGGSRTFNFTELIHVQLLSGRRALLWR